MPKIFEKDGYRFFFTATNIVRSTSMSGMAAAKQSLKSSQLYSFGNLLG